MGRDGVSDARVPIVGGSDAGPGRLRLLRDGGWRAVDLGALDPARERPFWLAIAGLPGVGPVTFARLLQRFGSAEAAWRHRDPFDGIDRLPPDTGSELAALRARGVGRHVRQLEDELARSGAVALTALDERYPRALAELDPRPPVLYVRGSPTALDQVCVAIVGTRRPSGYGRTTAREIADELARAGATVVSGLAIGIDGEAHTAAVDAGGVSVAVLPSPIDRVYPPRHRELADRLVARGGLVISELAPGHSVGRPDFARRNRIIAGLSRATVVVEAPDRSGALLTAVAAQQYGREVYAVPGPIDAATSRGCNRLIADQAATIVTSAVSLCHQLGASPDSRPISVASLSDAEGIVLAALLKRSGSIEELIDRSHLDTSPLASALTLLEARQLVTSYGGATFHPTLQARRLERQGRLR